MGEGLDAFIFGPREDRLGSDWFVYPPSLGRSTAGARSAGVVVLSREAAGLRRCRVLTGACVRL